MTNAQMKPGRFLRFHQARRKVAIIKAHLAAGGAVVVATCTKATTYRAKHAETFRATRSGVVVQRGKSWDSIEYCTIQLV